MDIDIITTRDLAILRCRGRLVFGDGAGPLGEAGRRALSAGRAVALDLDKVTQMDAHGTGVIAELADLARRQGSALMVSKVSDRARRLLRLTRLDSVIPGAMDAMTSWCDIPAPCHAVASARV